MRIYCKYVPDNTNTFDARRPTPTPLLEKTLLFLVNLYIKGVISGEIA